MNRIKQFSKDIVDYVLQNKWFLFLLLISTAYVYKFRNDIYSLKELNAQSLIFIIWLFLLLFPLFNEMEFLGIKVKKEVENATSDLKSSLHTLQSQVNQMQVTNSLSSYFYFNGSPLPTSQNLDDYLSSYLENHPFFKIQQESEDSPQDEDFPVYLFKVRLNIETTLRELCEKLGNTEHMPIYKMANYLLRSEVISPVTCDMISQVIKITNRGVHGEIVSLDYIDFVKKVNPTIIDDLNQARKIIDDKYIIY